MKLTYVSVPACAALASGALFGAKEVNLPGLRRATGLIVGRLTYGDVAAAAATPFGSHNTSVFATGDVLSGTPTAAILTQTQTQITTRAEQSVGSGRDPGAHVLERGTTRTTTTTTTTTTSKRMVLDTASPALELPVSATTRTDSGSALTTAVTLTTARAEETVGGSGSDPDAHVLQRHTVRSTSTKTSSKITIDTVPPASASASVSATGTDIPTCERPKTSRGVSTASTTSSTASAPLAPAPTPTPAIASSKGSTTVVSGVTYCVDDYGTASAATLGTAGAGAAAAAAAGADAREIVTTITTTTSQSRSRSQTLPAAATGGVTDDVEAPGESSMSATPSATGTNQL